MGRVRLRTKFLVAMLLTSAATTAITLWLVQRTVEEQVRGELAADLTSSVETFRNVQKEREATLARSAELIADLPNLKALMTSRHAPTIQDASADLFRLSGGDLFALLDPAGNLMAFHTRFAGVTRNQAQQAYGDRALLNEPLQWWFIGGHLYEVFLKSIYFGPSANNSVLGVVAIGYEFNDQLAQEVGRIAASDVAVVDQGQVAVTTLNPKHAADFANFVEQQHRPSFPRDLTLGSESFVATSLPLDSRTPPAVTMFVMKSYDQAAAFLTHLRQLLVAVGLGALLLGSVLVYVTARTFTQPLERLVEGVRALGKGDFSFPVQSAGASEINELAVAFTGMRHDLQDIQHRLLAAERLATIGRMASSISHDLRHPLTAVLANAEFLADANLNPQQREELYLEIRVAVNRLTDLVDSLLELARPANSLNLTEAALERPARRAVELIQAHPEFQAVHIEIDSSGVHPASFDGRKMERVFYNLLLNACQAVPKDGRGQVRLRIEALNEHLEVKIIDNGPGINDSVRDRMFQPFVSHGKENGTGMGLTIAQKIVQDHLGSLQVERSEPGCTVMQVILPKRSGHPADHVEARVGDVS